MNRRSTAVVLTASAVASGGYLAAPAFAAETITANMTWYSYEDNSPPNSRQIATGGSAGGDCTEENPTSLAANQGVFTLGETIIYLPFLDCYGIVEDHMGATGTDGADIRLDVWVGQSGAPCDGISGVHEVIVDPPSGLPVVPRPEELTANCNTYEETGVTPTQAATVPPAPAPPSEAPLPPRPTAPTFPPATPPTGSTEPVGTVGPSVMDATFTSPDGQQGQYHVYADGVDASAGLMVHFHGDDNGSSFGGWTIEGGGGLAEVAAANNMVLIVARTPAADGTWWESGNLGDVNAPYAAALIEEVGRQVAPNSYGRTWLISYSGGSTFLTNSFIVPEYADVIGPGGAVITGGGGSPDGGAFPAEFVENFDLHFYTGTGDDLLDLAQNGVNAYTAAGFDVTYEFPPGVGHGDIPLGEVVSQQLAFAAQEAPTAPTPRTAPTAPTAPAEPAPTPQTRPTPRAPADGPNMGRDRGTPAQQQSALTDQYRIGEPWASHNDR